MNLRQCANQIAAIFRRSTTTPRVLPPPRRLARFESLEDRILFSADFVGIPLWESQGPAPIVNTGSDGGLTSGNAIVAPNNPATGAVQAIAVNPNNAQQIYVATVNGGIWRTNNADPNNPGAITWTPLTDQQVSTAIGDIAFSPLDAAGNTLYAGTGTFSNLYWFNPPPTTAGILRTTDGGATWSNFAVNPANEGRIKAILPTGIDLDPTSGVQEMVLVATIDGGTGIWRSNDNGQTFALLSGANGLPAGAVSQLIADPNNAQRFYAGVPGQGVYRGDFNATTGVITWTQVNTNLTNVATSANIQLAAHDDGANTVLYAGLANGVSGINATLTGVFRSTDNGANWNPLGAPTPFNAFALAGSGFSLVADPGLNNVVYVSGLATTNDVARYRPGTNDWVSIVGTGNAQNNTQPHTDSRDLAFIGNNVLLDACDGGLYFMQNPTNATANQWRSFDQGLGPVEFHDIAWDSNSNIIIGGAQDNGVSYQQAINGLVWTQPLGADGADVAVDNLTLAGANQSIRYFSFQNLGQFRRQVFDAANATVGAAVNLLPAGGLANFTAQFITPIEVNVIAPPAGQSARLVIGGGGTSPIYESTNAGTAAAGSITWTAVGVPAGFGTVTSLVAGGRQNGADNAEVLYAGDSNGRVYFRSAAGALAATGMLFPGGNVVDIALDPNDWAHAFVASSSGVWETTNAGAGWVNRTGNLSNNIIQTIEFAELGATDAVLVGGEGGVFRMITNNPGVWSEYGRALPNAVTYDLDYNAADNVLIAGTFGRGAWKVINASTTLTVPGLLRINGQVDADTIELRREAGNPPMLDVFLDGVLDASVEFAVLDKIEVNGLGGDDLLIVNLVNGDVIPTNQVVYDGGADTDTLDIRSATFATVTYTVTGPASGSVALGANDVVTYSSVQQVTDRTTSANRVFNATSGDGTIRIVDDGSANGLSRINDGGAGDFAQHDFANPSGLLTVNGNGGADDIHLIGVDLPFAATVRLSGGSGDDSIAVDFGAGVSVVNVTGDNDDDTLRVNGTAGDDTILVTGTAVTRGGQAVNYDSTVEHLIVDGGAGDDDFTINGAAGEILGGSGLDTYLVLASAAPQLRLNGQGDSDDYTVNFGNLAGPVIVQDLGPLTDTDTLLVNGTSGADTIVATGIDVQSGGETIAYSGIEELTVNAGGGNDSITINGTGANETTVLGGDGDDTFVLNGSGPGSLTLDGEEGSDTYTVNLGGVFTGPVAIDDTGVNGTDSLNINGTNGPDWIILKDDGFSLDGLPATFTFKGIEQLTVHALGGDDIVDGSALTMKVTIFGGDGADTLIGGSNDDKLYGENGDDDLIGNLGADLLDGGAGSDALVGDQAVQVDKGRLEHETVTGPAHLLSIPGGKLSAVVDVPGTNRRLVTLRNETQGGADTLLGGDGDDYAYGGAANDDIQGGAGADALFGDLGDDKIAGGIGDDHLYGGSGNDSLDGEAGADIAYGGDGDDKLYADSKNDRLVDWFGNFNDFFVPGPGYGAPTIVRSPSPWVQDFLLNLARADGAANPNSQIMVVVPGGDLQQSNSGKGGRT